MRTAAIIVAAGRGTRAGGPVPKQYAALGGVPVLRRTIQALLPEVEQVQVVIHPDDRAHYETAVEGLALPAPVPGGATRADSVRAGLEALAADPPDVVLIHDAARPFVSATLIRAVTKALEEAEGACPALPVVDALWQGSDALEVPRAREGLLRAQTPQGFRFASILAAHRANTQDLADDVAVARVAEIEVVAVPGEERNFKITTPADLARAAREVERMTPTMDVRTGTGFDVHRLVPGDHVTLCGVEIPHDRALSGHSDADVAMHAITDAIFGALSEGDIGQWFPPSDPQWKGAASHIFLEKAVERAGARGAAITHLDCTIICEQPKIGPHAAAMRARIAEICGLAPERVSVKATTSERLGFPGRGEGIAAQAAATLVFA
ncbi:bifunctional 2-C-methyl-D-erythritol 4-phosphate cytidylyltransferase/2-C-methyl-D-erythritol 2,4-cyclodiphosphate synthase [Pontivivens ytuae]|uniref:Bifunctional enzyme IspD/IspF n=1 Tax=Pontivivens ytuae TaxID=2789856 RepID=A0A7S9LRH2_9RHOB|nr:bifunctional 2-C-methyl-D-erythritol 4-phosphate cytidylyltransferase/2-C-methyl-D-erythritol 2,4-cyclodiphosphate synthase [Pontivivens ytuae]QPH53892.1 bifunctional 2-C-methyl-D-erythritol 4-phosphate cytidylyltransferase/2-C-methyl-D-erythritol 2,4-cyclodiphosphate synthase [Pontivivens ytuae]